MRDILHMQVNAAGINGDIYNWKIGIVFCCSNNQHKRQTNQVRNNTKTKQIKEETAKKPNKSRKKQHTIQTSQERNNTKAKQVKEETTHNPNKSSKKQHTIQTS